MKVVTVTAHDVRSACATARRTIGVKRADSKEVARSGGEDGLYRVSLADGTVVECTVVHRSKTVVHQVRDE